MEWDKNTPLGSETIRFGAQRIREMKQYIHDALSREHEFPDNPRHKGGKLGVLVVGSPPSVGNNSIGWDSSQKKLYVGNTCVFDTEVFPSGTKAIFYQTTAPLGWSIISVSERLVYITKGSANGGVSGGTTLSGGTWTISGVTVSDHSHTFSVPSHQHEIPLGYSSGGYIYGGVAPWGYGHNFSYGLLYYRSVTEEGVSLATFKVSSNLYNASTGSVSTVSITVSHDGSWRPKGYQFILCRRD